MSIGPTQFAVFRISIGFFLLLFFHSLAPFSEALFSNVGMMSDPSLNHSSSLVPNIIYRTNSPKGLNLILDILVIAALFLATGILRRIAAVILWMGLVYFLNINNYITNPSLHLVGWMLLLIACVPGGESLSLHRKVEKSAWVFPKEYLWAAWLVMAVYYSGSGLTKLDSELWLAGTIPWHTSDIVSQGGTAIALPAEWIGVFGNYWTLFFELFFLPLCLFPLGRAVAWFGMVTTHLVLLVLAIFPGLTIGVLLIHILTFDVSWSRYLPFKGLVQKVRNGLSH